MTNSNLKIGYALTTSTKDGFIGAILVSDEKGFPLEFQYTDPIVPTKLQKVLYGASLEKYLKVDVILDNLLSVLSNKLDLIIVQDEQMLFYNKNKVDMVRIVETNLIDEKTSSEFEKVKGDEYIFLYSKTNSPIRVTFKDNVTEDSPLFTKISDITKNIGQYINITEPLERVQKSIEIIIDKQ